VEKMTPMHQSSIDGADDMIQLGDLHPASLYHNISLRFKRDVIYTFTGNILVAVNPYKPLAIYSLDTIRKYSGRALGSLPPHIYAIANEMFATLLKTRKNQCVVVRWDSLCTMWMSDGSGESGAGKTESTKFILNFLACVSHNRSIIHEQILEGFILSDLSDLKQARFWKRLGMPKRYETTTRVDSASF
jgi:myosin heavy subunit